MGAARCTSAGDWRTSTETSHPIKEQASFMKPAKHADLIKATSLSSHPSWNLSQPILSSPFQLLTRKNSNPEILSHYLNCRQRSRLLFCFIQTYWTNESNVCACSTNGNTRQVKCSSVAQWLSVVTTGFSVAELSVLLCQYQGLNLNPVPEGFQDRSVSLLDKLHAVQQNLSKWTDDITWEKHKTAGRKTSVS